MQKKEYCVQLSVRDQGEYKDIIVNDQLTAKRAELTAYQIAGSFTKLTHSEQDSAGIHIEGITGNGRPAYISTQPDDMP